jgi:hypothetical protein
MSHLEQFREIFKGAGIEFDEEPNLPSFAPNELRISRRGMGCNYLFDIKGFLQDFETMRIIGDKNKKEMH